MIKAIVAMDPHRLIGAQGRLPWHLPEDLRFFKQTTMGHPIVMGRKTYESIGKPLPGRENIVLTHSPDLWKSVEGITPFSHLEELLVWSQNITKDIFVIGGVAIYELFLPYIEELIITHLHQSFVGDAFFPPWQDLFDKGKVLHDESREKEGFTIRCHSRKRLNS